MNHECNEHKEIKNKFDHFELRKYIYSHGQAIGSIKYNEKANIWHTDNDEYTTIINFCPFCGIKLEVK